MGVRRRYLSMVRVLLAGGELTTALCRERFGVTASTAKRDLAMVEAVLPVVTARASHRHIHRYKVVRLRA
jgi:predicted DNA-binding transcriptional regulator YafY